MPSRIQSPDASLSLASDAPDLETRRSFLGKSGLVLSGAAVALLAGRDVLAKGNRSAGSGVNVLNSALGAELEAIAAFQVGAVRGLLQKPVLNLAETILEF